MARFAAAACSLALAGFLPGSARSADITIETVALSGQQAPGAPVGAVFDKLSLPVLNDHNEVAFQSTLEVGPGGVETSSDNGIWLLDRTGELVLVAREGDPAPGAPQARPYGQILGTTGVPRLNDAGQVAFYGSYKFGSSTVLAIFGPDGQSELTLLAAASSVWGNPPGVPGALARFASFERPSLNDAGEVVFVGDLYENVGGVTNQDDGGLWGTLGGGGLHLLYREDDTAPPEAGGARWGAFRPPRLNDAGQLAIWASLRGQGVNEYNKYSHWGPGPGGFTLLTRTWDLEPPGALPGETPATLFSPELDASGSIAFRASLYLPQTGVESATFGPIEAGGHTLLVREGGQAPGLPAGVVFSTAGVPALSDAGHVVFLASIRVDGVEVTSADNAGIWGPDAASPLALLARRGHQAGSLAPGVLYDAFQNVKISDSGDVAFLATLVHGAGGVDASNDEALFLIPRDGPSIALLRTGDSIEVAPGDSRTLTDVDVYLDSLRSDSRDLIVNDRLRVAVRADFSDGSRGVFLVGLQERDCNDGVDNDGDGSTDFQIDGSGDPECLWASDRNEDVYCGLGVEVMLLLPLLWYRQRRAQEAVLRAETNCL